MQGRDEDAEVENGLVDTVGKGESGMNGESSIGIHILSYVKQAASKKMLYNTQEPGLHSVMTLRGRLGGEEGSSKERLYMYNYG